MEGKAEDNEEPVVATGLDREVPKPEAKDNYLNASGMFPIGNSYARGKVTGLKIYAYENVVGRTNSNPIIDTHKYCVEFDAGGSQ